jgi:hypothetical protein
MKRGAYGNVGQRLEGEQPTRSSRLRRGVYLKSTAQMLNWRSRAPYFYPDGSGRQGCNLAGESPAISIARFGYVAIPQFLWVTTSPLRGVNGLAALKEFSGGCNLGA